MYRAGEEQAEAESVFRGDAHAGHWSRLKESGQFRQYGIHQSTRNVQRKLCVQFAYAGGAGNIDFGEIVANNIDAGEN